MGSGLSATTATTITHPDNQVMAVSDDGGLYDEFAGT